MNVITRTLVHRLLAAAMLLVLALAAGCSLIDPVVSVGTPPPQVSERAQPKETGARPTAAPSPSDTLLPSATPGAEPTAEPNGAGAYTIAADTSESQKTYYSEAADENALRAENGANASIDGATVEKRKGDASSLENTLDYGLNAAILVHGKAELLLIVGDVTSAATGAGGVYAYDGTLRMEGGNVRTNADSSFGLAAVHGGEISLKETSVSTKGAFSPAVLALRDGGISMEGGIAATSGKASPALESEGAIRAANATLRANNAEAADINGGSVTLTDCAVSGSMGDVISADALVEPYCVALYNDADPAGRESAFTMTRGALTAVKGDLFYATNTYANIYLEGVSLSLPEGRALLRASGNDASRGWGAAGSNGAVCALTAQDQTLCGDIVADELSSVSLTLKGKTNYTGTVNTANTARAAEVTLGNGASWILTGNAYLTAFTGRVGDIVTNGFTVYVNGAALTK